MNASEFLLSAAESVRLFGTLNSGLDRSAEFARQKASTAMDRLAGFCAQYGAGMDIKYAEVSRAAHDAAFEFMTYGEICVSLEVLPESQSLALVAAGLAVQDRALEQEGLFLAGGLSPSEVFYDDLIHGPMLEKQHVRVLLQPDIESLALASVRAPPVTAPLAFASA